MLSRREFDRLKITNGIQAQINLETHSYHSDFLVHNETAILVVDISAGGLKFMSKLDFPVNYIAIYKTSINIDGKALILYGKIIRKRKLMNEAYEYGFKFDFNYVSNRALYGSKIK
ncbi:PilZ domain-containing protein [Bacillus sp. DNRA2]|uniref:PilZ domain-containing protein n=1 Tax=Bacillus sp. DNRA2 TaxID=2723053 RepID=UPI00145EC966|nr:PilZ domain-containing protein [Bacillus sp. DNRA2]